MSIQAAPELGAEPLRCGECDELVGARVRHAFGQEVYLAVDTHPYRADLVITKARGEWLVRDLVPNESVAKDKLRSRHVCVPHPYGCGAAKSPSDSRSCNSPARLFPIGTRCERHRP
jgi:hypothetical protein